LGNCSPKLAGNYWNVLPARVCFTGLQSNRQGNGIMKIIENITLELTATELEELRRELYAVLFFTQLNNKELNSKLEKTKEFYKVLYNS